MTRCYIASKFENVVKVRELKNLLESAGHTISYDWTPHFDKPNSQETANQIEAAKLDFKGVVDCEIFVLICHPNMKGAFFEFGAAMALGKPCIVVGRAPHSEMVFFHLPGVVQLETIDSVVPFIKDYDAQMKLAC